MVKWDGSEQLQLTSTPDGESSPRWSPDGKYLAFVASRAGTKKKAARSGCSNRAGGEAQKVTDVKGGVGDYEWSPDSTRLVFVVDDQDPDRRPEKMDELEAQDADADRRSIATTSSGRRRLPRGKRARTSISSTSRRRRHDSADAGQVRRRIAVVVARRQADRVPQASAVGDPRSHVERATSGSSRRAQAPAPRQLTTTADADGGRPAWSPDGKPHRRTCWATIRKFDAYDLNKLAVDPGRPAAQPRVLTPQLDRPVSSPRVVGGRARRSRSSSRTIARSTSPRCRRAGGRSARCTTGQPRRHELSPQARRRQLRRAREHADAAREVYALEERHSCAS